MDNQSPKISQQLLFTVAGAANQPEPSIERSGNVAPATPAMLKCAATVDKSGYDHAAPGYDSVTQTQFEMMSSGGSRRDQNWIRRMSLGFYSTAELNGDQPLWSGRYENVKAPTPEPITPPKPITPGHGHDMDVKPPTPEPITPCRPKIEKKTSRFAGLYGKPNEFPFYSDGDVLVTSPSGGTWRLHYDVLARASPKLKTILDGFKPVKSPTRHQLRRGENLKWKLEMINEPLAQQCDANGIKFKTFRAVPLKARVTKLPPNLNGANVHISYNEIYDTFFRILYNEVPNWVEDPDDQAKNLIVHAKEVLEAASFLQAIPAVRQTLEACLLRQNQAIWKHIADQPQGWVHFAAVLQSPLIFRESMLHIVGRMNTSNEVDMAFLSGNRFGELGRYIWRLIQTKGAELKEKKVVVERRLFDYYPVRMMHKSDGMTIPGRALYSADIYFWFALSLIRQYFSSVVLSNQNHRAKDGGLAFFRTIDAERPTYITAATLEKFHENFNMSNKSRLKLMAAVDEIKQELRKLVADILRCESQSNKAGTIHQWSHFTCTKILDEELPWVAQLGSAEADGAEARANSGTDSQDTEMEDDF